MMGRDGSALQTWEESYANMCLSDSIQLQGEKIETYPKTINFTPGCKFSLLSMV